MNIFDNKFDSYGKALAAALNDRGLTPTWLAKKLHIEGNKPSFDSLRSMISRWLSGDPVGLKYQKRINSIFDFTIKQAEDGKWIVSRTEQKSKKVKNSQSLDEYRKSKASPSLEDKLKEYESRKADSNFSDTERDLLLEYLLSHAESLSEGLRRLVEIEKDRDRQ